MPYLRDESISISVFTDVVNGMGNELHFSVNPVVIFNERHVDLYWS